MYNLKNITIMKKFILALTALLTMTVSANAMSYEQAREQALFLTDKMAYELNLTEDQYEAAYEINLDYLMSINNYDDLYGLYWERRNMDLSYILLDWQYRAYCAASYFYRPLYWDRGYWHFGIYARYPHRTYFYFGRPHFYVTYRGGHSWHMNGGRSWYNGRSWGMAHRNVSGGRGFGMRNGFDRGDYRNGARGIGHNDRGIGSRGNGRSIENRGSMNRGGFGNSRSIENRGGNINRNMERGGSMERNGSRSIEHRGGVGSHSMERGSVGSHSMDRGNSSINRSGSSFGGGRSSSMGTSRSSSIGSNHNNFSTPSHSSFGRSSARQSSTRATSPSRSSFSAPSRSSSHSMSAPSRSFSPSRSSSSSIGSRSGGGSHGGSHGGGHSGGHFGGRR